MSYPLSALIEYLSSVGMPCNVDGDPRREVNGVATLEEAGPNDISFLSNPKYESTLQTTQAGAVIVSNAQKVPSGLTVLRIEDPYAAVTAVMVHIHGYRKHKKVGINRYAVVDSSAMIGDGAQIHHGVTIESDVSIGKNVVIYPGCYLAEKCRLGDDCVLYPNVVLYDGTILGHRVTIHAGTVLAEDGLGYAPLDGKWFKIPQIGIVEIGDDVEIGANCTIDRATLGRTVVAAGTKFSNLIAIGHGTKVGEHCMLVAQVGLAGSVNVGRHVTMAGKVGVAGHLNIGDNAQLGAMSGVMKDIPPDTSVAGLPAIPIKDALRTFSFQERLPEFHKRIKELEAQVDKLKQSLEEKAAQ